MGLEGASAVFGPQKGASPDDVQRLDAALGRWAEVLQRDLPGAPPGLASCPGQVRPAGSVRRYSHWAAAGSPASNWCAAGRAGRRGGREPIW